MRKYIKQILKIAVSILLILLLSYKVGFKEIYETLRTVNSFYLILMIIVFLISFLIASINIKILLLPLKARRLGLKKLVWYNMLTYAISRFIPGRVGELSMVYFLKKEDIAIGRASAIVLIDRITSFFVHFTLACFGFFIFFPSIVAVRLTCISILIFVVLIFFIIWKKGRDIVKKYVLRKHSNMFAGFYKTFSGYFKHYKYLLLINVIITLVNIFFFGLMVYLAFFAINQQVNISVLTMMIITSITEIISLIPITISGLGVRETSAVFMFSKLSILAEFTMSAYLILLLIRYVSSGIILLVWTWSKKHG